ncbi:MAG: CRISPR-associated endonuclease Cas3'' [Planctomycetota bacterium]|nr:CRISPR-associated endonuclease Cas3'' [Planctomycetota bacterium]
MEQQYWAHSHPSQPEPGNKWQPLCVHLRNVAELARQFAEAARPGDKAFAQTAHLAGLLHDLGKYRTEFQEYLKNKESRVAHAPVGAAKALTGELGIIHAFAPYGHHAGLPAHSAIKGVDQRYKDALVMLWPEAVNDCPELSSIKKVKIPEEIATVPLRSDVWIRMLFSCLVDADWCDTNAWEEGKHPYTYKPPPLNMKQRQLQLKKFVSDKPQKGDVNAIRREVMESCLRAAEMTPGVFSLSVPTGGGKTLASLAFALKHCQNYQHLAGPKRIITVIPYLNILGQTANEYYEAIKVKPEDGTIFEHHSLSYADQPSKQPLREAKEPENEAESPWAKRMEENWIAPIILTTSVQFFESLFSNRPAAARKLHHIARSVVIFDECQTFPTGLYRPTLSMLKELVDYWGVSFVFCTATQPAIRQSRSLPDGIPADTIHEIMPDTSSLFQRMHRTDSPKPRVEVTWPSKDEVTITWQKLAEQMRLGKEKQALAIVNIKDHARRLFDALSGKPGNKCPESVFHLSTYMCSRHRYDLLEVIKHRLKTKKPCLVASTQLVEAGVNLDFPAVFRALGPLDSIAQAAGRCNREGLLTDDQGKSRAGQVVVFRPELDENESETPPGEYRIATDTCKQMLAEAWNRNSDGPDILDPQTYDYYFEKTLAKLDPDSKSIQGDPQNSPRNRLDFPEVCRLYRIIENNTFQIIVPYSPDGNRDNSPVQPILTKIRASGRVSVNQSKQLQPYLVNLYRHHFERARKLGLLEPLADGWWGWAGKYDLHLGIIFEQELLCC